MKNKQRHGCLTAWLIYLIISYSIVSFGLFFNSEVMTKKLTYITSENVMLIVASIGIINILFSFMLLKWVKLGFWGLIFTSGVLSIIQIINSGNMISPIVTIICVLILYGLLQLKKNNASGWNNLD